MIDVRCPLCKNRYSCQQIGMIPFEHCGMFVIDDTIKRHKTNADRIRAMTDEELAEKIGESIDCEVCKTMHHSENDECPSKPHQACVDFWLDWLRQEENDAKSK